MEVLFKEGKVKDALRVLNSLTRFRPKGASVQGILQHDGTIVFQENQINEVVAAYLTELYKNDRFFKNNRTISTPLPTESFVSLAEIGVIISQINTDKALGPHYNSVACFQELIPNAGTKSREAPIHMTQLKGWALLVEAISGWVNIGKPMPDYFNDKRIVMLSKVGNPLCSLDDIRFITVAD